ncbi:MAG: DUF1289 domain-containing protein [Burkholderiaceae bacterium]|nr:DUF1289 domain-containing protein [Burkholderiaceae bacterium]
MSGSSRESRAAAAAPREAGAASRPGAARASIPSPCISVCRIDPASGSCEGCLRTLDEIARWGSMNEEARSAVWHALEQRRSGHTARPQAAESLAHESHRGT